MERTAKVSLNDKRIRFAWDKASQAEIRLLGRFCSMVRVRRLRTELPPAELALEIDHCDRIAELIAGHSYLGEGAREKLGALVRAFRDLLVRTQRAWQQYPETDPGDETPGLRFIPAVLETP
jgi:hypothetical protein